MMIEETTLSDLLSDLEDAAMAYQEAKAWGNSRFDTGAEGRALEAARAAVVAYVLTT